MAITNAKTPHFRRSVNEPQARGILKEDKKIVSKQPGKIWQNFATLANFWRFISYLAKYWAYFGKIVTLLG